MGTAAILCRHRGCCSCEIATRILAAVSRTVSRVARRKSFLAVEKSGSTLALLVAFTSRAACLVGLSGHAIRRRSVCYLSE